MFGFAKKSKKMVGKVLNLERKMSVVNLDSFGQHVFKGTVAAKHLTNHGLLSNTLENSNWVNNGSADKVAAAVLDWAKENGASVYCHWFQPLGSSYLRHGQTAMVQNSMVDFDINGQPVWAFKGKNLLTGETDGSSFPNGGMRATHCAGAYMSVDPTSPIFLRGDAVFIPACLTSYFGHSLDEKTPLHRASDALSREGARLLNLLGYKDAKGVHANIGLEQELFLVPREVYLRRPDLQLTGRTVLGRMPARGQELSDHYMGAMSESSPALNCLREIQQEAYRLGIPLATRHREVAPNQFEFCPKHGAATVQIDQNLLVMQLIEEVAAKHGLAALLHEKPFQGINGSGKHNNWSIAASHDNTNLLNVAELARNSGSADIFPVVMAAIVKAVHQHGDLMRMAIASPGNDFRLGACEAPPSIMSVYLGEDMTNFLQKYAGGDQEAQYVPSTKQLDRGASQLPQVVVSAEDRNRTSPFPYGGHRFEFRAVGSSQNVSLVNTVLATITADSFRQFSDAIEAGQSARTVAQEALKTSWKTIFNGNNYDLQEQEALTAAGVWRIDSSVDAICRYTAPKNVALFEQMGVLTAEECAARQTVLLAQYAGLVAMECGVMVDMLRQHVIPAVKTAQVGPLEALQGGVASLLGALEEMERTSNLKEKAALARTLRLETMIRVRGTCDDAEAVVPAGLWTLGTYKELLFLDLH